jgi:hypothetical protein
VDPDFWFLDVQRTLVRLRVVGGSTVILYAYQAGKPKG